MICRKYFFQKLTHFSDGHNVLEASASNIDTFPWSDTVVSSTLMNRPIWNKISLSAFLPHEKYDFQEVFLSKLPPLS
jgi:hypothetical protein